MPVEVSIVIPVYNTGKILQETVDSVLNQTVKEFELIIVDDGSSDPETQQILDRQDDKRIKIIRQENAGVAAARNSGLHYAQGKYIAFLDHDDLWLPEKLQRCLTIFEDRQDAVLVYSDTLPFGEYHNRRICLQKAEGRIFSTMIEQNPILSMSCSMVKKTFLEQHNIRFNSDCVPCDDWDFHLQCALYGSIYCSEDPLVKYRYHENNLSSNAIKMYYAGIRVIDKYQKLLDKIASESGFPRQTLQKSINSIAFKHCYGLAFEYLKLHKIPQALKYLFDAFLYSPFKCTARILCYAGKLLKKITCR